MYLKKNVIYIYNIHIVSAIASDKILKILNVKLNTVKYV